MYFLKINNKHYFKINNIIINKLNTNIYVLEKCECVNMYLHLIIHNIYVYHNVY